MNLLNLGIAVLGLCAVLIVFVILAPYLQPESEEKKQYRYTRKKFFLTKSEHELYDMLVQAVGTTYYVFAQVHLSDILDYKTERQDWRAARGHIDRKSVDFVLCDKASIFPKLVIELDDPSHERPDRVARDAEVERILKEAALPLLRLTRSQVHDVAELATQIQKVVLL